MKQKMVIRVHMKCKKCRVKTMEIVATTSGISSLEVREDGEITIIGDDVDLISTVSSLRKKVGTTTIVSVNEMKEQKKVKENTPPLSPSLNPYPYQYPSLWPLMPYSSGYPGPMEYD